MEEKSINSRIVVKCSKCKEMLFLECENCHKKSEWKLSPEEIECGCGEIYVGWLCECGVKTMLDEFQVVDNELVEKKKKELLGKRSSST
ncbi:MAG: hypothetical protein ACQ9MH_12950 [Nitrospinales bacterium]